MYVKESMWTDVYVCKRKSKQIQMSQTTYDRVRNHTNDEDSKFQFKYSITYKHAISWSYIETTIGLFILSLCDIRLQLICDGYLISLDK